MAANPPTPGSNSASDAVDYVRNLVDTEWPDLSASFDAMAASSLEGGVAISIAEIGATATAEMVGLEPLGFAAAAMLGMYISGWILTKVAQFFPNPGIFGFHPLNFLVEGIDSLGKEWEHTALSVIDDVRNFILQPFRMIHAVFQRIGTSIGVVNNKVATVVTSVIPMAVAGGITRAEAYTQREIENIQTQLAGAVNRLTGTLSEAQAKTLISDANRYGGIGWDITAVAAEAVVSSIEFSKGVASTAASDLATTSAQVAANAKAALDTFHTQLINQLAGDENMLRVLSNTVNVTLPADITNQVNQARASATKSINDATTQLQNEINTVQSEITALQSRITSDETVISTATANIAALQNAQVVDQSQITTQRQLITTAQSDILSNITSIKDLNTKITGISNTLAPVQAAQQLNTAQLAPFESVGGIALPTVLATLSTTLNQVKTKVDTCMVDNCDTTSPNNIRNVLKDLLDLMTAAGEIGFIAEAINNPVGVANAIAPALGTIDTGATNTLNALLGLL